MQEPESSGMLLTGSKATAASLQERRAYLLSLLDTGRMVHGGYIAEKIEMAMLPNVTVGQLKAMLDVENTERYEHYLAQG